MMSPGNSLSTGPRKYDIYLPMSHHEYRGSNDLGSNWVLGNQVVSIQANG